MLKSKNHHPILIGKAEELPTILVSNPNVSPVLVVVDAMAATNIVLLCKTEESPGPWWLPCGKQKAQWKQETNRRQGV